METKLNDAESRLEESQAMVKMLSIPPPDVPGADRHELLRLLDRRQHEIDRLSEEWKSLSAKLASVALEKSEFQTRFENQSCPGAKTAWIVFVHVCCYWRSTLY